MRKIKIARIGTGNNSHGNSVWKNLLKQTDLFEAVRGKENPYSYDYERGLYRLILRSCGKEIQQ